MTASVIKVFIQPQTEVSTRRATKNDDIYGTVQKSKGIEDHKQRVIRPCSRDKSRGWAREKKSLHERTRHARSDFLARSHSTRSVRIKYREKGARRGNVLLDSCCRQVGRIVFGERGREVGDE